MSDGFAIYPSLRDRVVFITGGASGIGAEHVTQFVAQGAKVAFVDIAEGPAQALLERIKGTGRHAPLYRHCDLKDIAALQGVIAEVGQTLGPVTILVNNAANDQRHKFEDVTVEYWDERLATNLRHQFFAIQAVAPMMRAAGGGSIINFGSVSWHSLQGGMPAYTTAKAGVEGLTRGMARDLGPDRIRVNTVIPGWIMTERQITLWLTPEAEQNLLQVQCLKEKLAPADVTRLVLWLASDDSRMCTAQLWIVDAGKNVTYSEFWLRYLRAHSRSDTRMLHYIGSALALGALVAGLAMLDWRLLIAAPLVGYAFAWTAHFAIERNRPETFGHPFWSLLSDYRMLLLAFSFRLAPHLHRAGVR